MCDAFERGKKGIYSKFHYELLGFKKGREQRGSLVSCKTNYNLESNQ